jgi:ferredoxin
LGACLGRCPEGAITIEKREAEEYDEVSVIKQMIPKGENLLIAHLKHLKDHGETSFLKEAAAYLRSHADEFKVDVPAILQAVHNSDQKEAASASSCGSGGGCPGSAPVSFDRTSPRMASAISTSAVQSELQQWPVQMHLINPGTACFKNTELLVAADCAAFAHGNFHQTFIRGKKLVIACPKLDHGKDIYLEKLIRLILGAKVNTITVAIMEVPCCRGLAQLVQMAVEQAGRKVPVKEIVIGINGDILDHSTI